MADELQYKVVREDGSVQEVVAWAAHIDVARSAFEKSAIRLSSRPPGAAATRSGADEVKRVAAGAAVFRRKGELSAAGIDRGWPYQVALRADECKGTHYRTIHAFCLGLSLCSRGHCVRYDDEWWQVFCFAEREHADAFRVRFGGEHFDPKDRGRGASWAKWNRRTRKVQQAMIDSAEKRGQIIKHLEDALALADELNDGPTGYLIERALDEARATRFRPVG